ncbi:pyruvate carboxylase, beta subunit [Candidatus Desulfofervidus auxilii]|uniref:Pyruvate carboxylase, beta subunit n=1 Tax=Desulfofervidus auxilii TaxID=1621989 RepID=A0A7U4QMV2_DESA2|nr:biotin/lipoyl-containing protein [Candidatus Desulfofervidus auxilii]AMM42259.1 pyruvate carboxylase, beta subunit [Candidatus Desulfofervidus auxilii]
MRITRSMSVNEILSALREAKGYYITNTQRDLSQSDFKNRILLHTDLLAAPYREKAGYFSLEISGGASVHVDMLRKQVNPFLKLQLLREEMPNTMFQTLCRGVNLFGYRPYPENAIRLTVREFAKYLEVWRVFDFLNYIPNMISVFEEVKKADKLLEPCICFSTGPEHTDEYYVSKVREILEVTGEDIILCIKNHGGLGTPARIGRLVAAIKQTFPDLIIHYHGHNTDGNDIGRILEAVKNGAKIVDAGDHAFTGFYGPPPILTVIDTLEAYGFKAEGIDRDAVIATSHVLRKERLAYADFESQYKGFDSTVQIHKLPGGAMGSSLEQAEKGGFLHLMPKILLEELPKVQRELGNWWSVTPGSQILWTTAVDNVLSGERYANPSGDLKNLLLERYGSFPFYRPKDEIYKKVFGPDWKKILEKEGGLQKIEPVDLNQEKKTLEEKLGREVTTEELVLYLQHPTDAVAFFKFEEKFGHTYVLPPQIWFRRGGFELGEKISFIDYKGKSHIIEVGPTHYTDGKKATYFVIDFHPVVLVSEEKEKKEVSAAPALTKEEIEALAQVGDIRSPFNGSVQKIEVKIGDEVKSGDVIVIIEAMKMQTPLKSEVEGKVERIFVKEGDQIKTGDRLVFIKKK